MALNERGYQCFIVNYRVNPYTECRKCLRYARAVRYVRANADKYGVDENQIAGAGFSYGGIESPQRETPMLEISMQAKSWKATSRMNWMPYPRI